MPTKKATSVLALALASLALEGCATSHLVRWSKGEKSYYAEPSGGKEYVIAPATVIMFPVTLGWDIVTFPFQLIWGIYPYGGDLDPKQMDGKT